MTPKDPFLEGIFWDNFWRPIRSRALLSTPEILLGIQGTSAKTTLLETTLLRSPATCFCNEQCYLM